MKKLLIVDDEKDILLTLKMCLKDEGYDVTTINESEKALDHLEKESFDLIISDIKMPGMDGLELAGEIRKINKTVRIILMTGYLEINNRKEATAELDLSGFLDKPLRDIDEFLTLVSSTLSEEKSVL